MLDKDTALSDLVSLDFSVTKRGLISMTKSGPSLHQTVDEVIDMTASSEIHMQARVGTLLSTRTTGTGTITGRIWRGCHAVRVTTAWQPSLGGGVATHSA